jgi:hypothetical protein
VPQGFAPPPPEEFIQQQIPDVIPQAVLPSSFPPQQYVAPTPPQGSVNLPHIVNPQPKQEVNRFVIRDESKPLITRSDIDSIRNSLKNIDKSLSGLLSYFKNSKSDNE